MNSIENALRKNPIVLHISISSVNIVYTEVENMVYSVVDDDIISLIGRRMLGEIDLRSLLMNNVVHATYELSKLKNA